MTGNQAENDIQATASEVRRERLLGEYLIEQGVCSAAEIEEACRIQGLRRNKLQDDFLGEILIAGNVITRKGLEHVLQLQDMDILITSPIFSSLTRQELYDIYQASEVGVYASWETIFNQGEPSRTACVIIKGAVSLTYQQENGIETDYAIRLAGEVFGEMSLLAGERRFATAIAAEKTRILAIPKSSFENIFQHRPDIARKAIRKWYRAIVDGRVRTQAYQGYYYRELLSVKEEMPCLPIIGESRPAGDLRRRLQEMIASDKPILLIGEPGTMKMRIAQYVHEISHENKSPVHIKGPFIVFDPQRIPSFTASNAEQKSQVSDEEQQATALFGQRYSHTTSREVPWQGFIKIAHNGVVVIKNCQDLTAEVQNKLAEFIITGKFNAVGASIPSHAATRIIFITESSTEMADRLLFCLQERTLEIASLRSRKKDLKKITNYLIEIICDRQKRDTVKTEPEAMNKIIAYNWPGNFRELEDVMVRAVSLKKGDHLLAEDIFIGNVPITGKAAYNLLRLPLVRDIFTSSWYPTLPRAFIAGAFLLVIALGIWGSPAAESNISLLLIWANWEPLLIISCLFLARAWCGFCPIGFLAEFFQALKIKRKNLSARNLKKFFYLSAVGLAVVFWSQAALDMWTRPRETAGLLLAMLASAVIFSLLYEGRIWCRYICPLGQMVATFARISMVEMRTNYSYCSHECRTYDCSVGNRKISGCPMAKGPFSMETNQNCNLCGNCIKNCPHHSVRLNLRPPGRELWHARSADLAVLLFIPLLWGTQIFRGLVQAGFALGFTEYINSQSLAYALLLVLAVVFAFHVALAGIAFMGKLDTSAGTDYGSIFVLSMLPVIYANEIAIRLVPLLNHAADFFSVLGRQIGYNMPQLAFRLDMDSIHILQVVLVVGGLFFSIIVSNKQVRMIPSYQVAPALFRYLPLFAMGVISIALF